ncbi:MAG: nitrous oxide reductase accessory protein NosL [Chitinophagales bacterium]|nr:nitrous oxide reductase accessory protein NosL [Chitinophagales bacterium]
MKTKLSFISRIAIAFASGALLCVFFLPAWRIDLFAPQYPEGLTMRIWINGLSGQVDIINGLNHYIGMKHISEEMFPEFSYLPYVVFFYLLIGMIIVFTGSKKWLVAYLGLIVLGGLLAMYDFYQWGYSYGHELDPNAAIRVPGLSYQPPLIGHKRLLNFDAYSFPDIGGWVVIGASALAFLVGFVEWTYPRFGKKRASLPLVACLFAFFAVSCQVKPRPIQVGKDNCDLCRMTIMDPKFGAEIVTNKGKTYVFDDMICLYRFSRSGIINPTDISLKVVVDYDQTGSFVEIDKAWFRMGPDVNSPMGSHVAGYANQTAAAKKGTGEGIRILNWKDLSTAWEK